LAIMASSIWLCPRVAAAQELPVELSWRAPAACPQRDAVLDRVSRMLGQSRPKTKSVRAQGDIQELDNGFELHLAIDDGGYGGERRVWAKQCDELGGAAAVTLVLLLTATPGSTPTDLGFEPPNPDPPKPPNPDPPNPAPPKPPLKIETGGEARRVRFFLTAPQFALAVGPLPKPAFGIGFGLGVEGAFWSLRVMGQWGLKQRVPSKLPAYGATVQRATAGLWGCLAIGDRVWTLLPCAHLSVIHLQATGYGPLLRSISQTDTSAAAGLGLLGRVHLSRSVALMVGAGGQIELNRPQILLAGIGPVRKLAPLSATIVFGPEWFF
jgi:hypothetical protein